MDSALMAGAFLAADEMEYPNRYVFVIDVPGLKPEDITIQVDGNVLRVTGERKKDDEKGAKYLTKERRVGKFMRKFVLPENANMDAVSAVCQDGVLSVTVEKLPPPQPKKPKTIDIKVAAVYQDGVLSVTVEKVPPPQVKIKFKVA